MNHLEHFRLWRLFLVGTEHPELKPGALRRPSASLWIKNAFAFGELLFFEGLQRKVTAPPKDPASLLPGAPPRAEDARLRCLQTLSPSASYFSLKGCKEK